MSSLRVRRLLEAGLFPIAIIACAVGLVPRAVAQGEACPVSLAASEHLALATVVVSNPCRRDPDQVVKLFYDDNFYLGHFDADGKAAISFVLTRPGENRVLIVTAEGARLRRTIEAPDFAQVYRITMQWQAPVRLRLHVVEPGRRLGQVGDINEVAPNRDGAAGSGMIDLAGQAPAADALGESSTAEQSYVLADVQSRARGVFTPYFEYASRGGTPEPPYCGTERLASVPYRLFVIEGGRVATDLQLESPRAPCGQRLLSQQQRIYGLQ